MNRKTIGYYNYTVVLTYLGMVSACIAIFLAIEGNPFLSIWFMLFSGLCDMFDGTVASTKKDRDEDQKKFGIQIDSLCDLVGFGLAPGIFVYTVSSNKIAGGFAAVIVSLAAVIRLAYFNVQEEHRQKEETGCRKSYLGLPVTTIVLTLPLAYVLLKLFGADGDSMQYYYQAVAILVGIGFITPVQIRKPQRIGKIILLIFGLAEIGAMLLFK